MSLLMLLSAGFFSFSIYWAVHCSFPVSVTGRAEARTGSGRAPPHFALEVCFLLGTIFPFPNWLFTYCSNPFLQGVHLSLLA